MTEKDKRAYMKKYREKVKKMNRSQIAEEWERVTGILKPGGPEAEEEEEQESGGRLIERKGSAWRLKGVPWIELQENARITKETAQKIYGALAKLKDYESTGLTPEEVEGLTGMGGFRERNETRCRREELELYEESGSSPGKAAGGEHWTRVF